MRNEQKQLCGASERALASGKSFGSAVFILPAWDRKRWMEPQQLSQKHEDDSTTLEMMEGRAERSPSFSEIEYI